MKTHEIETTFSPSGKKGAARSVKVNMVFPETIEEAEKLWTAPVLLAMATRAAVIQLQASIRASLGKVGDKRVTEAQVAAVYKDFKPEVGRESLSEVEKVQRFISKTKLSKVELMELLKNVK